VKPIESIAKSASTSKTGLLALLRRLLHVKGTSALEISQGTGAPSTKPTKRVSLGRPTAVKTFTRNNNKEVMSRNAGQARTQGVITKQSCVANFTQLRSPRFTSLRQSRSPACIEQPRSPRFTPLEPGLFFLLALVKAARSFATPVKPSRSPACIEQLGSFGFTLVRPSRSLLPHSKPARFSLCASVLASLAFTVAPASALAAGPEAPRTEPASEVKAKSAVVNGVLSPAGPGEVGSSYDFLYRPSETECKGGGATSPVVSIMGLEAEPVSEPLAGLAPGTTYAVCLVVHNAANTEETVGPPVTFTTVAVPKTEAVTLIGSTTATFNGKLTPLNEKVETEYFFYYNFGEEPACTFEQATGAVDAGTGMGTTKTVSMLVGGLEPGEKYTVCLAAYNTLGAFEVDPSSLPIHFETKPAPPEIVTESESATPVTPDEETLNVQINANNQEITYIFEYSTTESAGELTGTVTKLNGTIAPEPFGAQPVTVNAPGLVQNTTYYYRVTTENTADEQTVGKVEPFTTLLETPETLPASPVTSSAATLNGVLSPNATAQGEAGTYEFAYRQSPSGCQGEGGKTAPMPAEVALGGKEAVSAVLTGLPPDATYTYCLLERSAANATAVGAAVTFTTRGAGISEEYVSEVEASAAILHAQINPNESSTSYHFEYDTTPYTSSAAHGTSLPSGGIPAGTSPVPVSVQLQSLSPGITYYYRVVAVSELASGDFETFDGPDKTLTTNAAPSATAETCPNAQARTEQPYGQALPDCRAYELVSPLKKNDRGVEAIDSRASVSDQASGPEASAVAYISRGSFANPRGATEYGRYISRRGADGWLTQGVTPLSVAFEPVPVAFAELLFTPDLSTGLVFSQDVPLVSGEEAGYDGLYVADLASTPVSYQMVTNVNPRYAPYEEQQVGYPSAVGVSTDLSHVAFQQVGNLTVNAEGTNGHVYEWAGGKLSLVDVPPAGTKFEYGDQAGAPGNFGLPRYGDTWHAVSADGLRVFFTAGSEGNGGNQGLVGQLYVRENPEQEQSPEPAGKCTVSSDACTVEVSASQRTNTKGEPEPDPNGPQPAYFRDANAEGTRVFFTSRAELTSEANTDEDKTANLYEYDFDKPEGKQLTDLTVNAEANGAAVLGLVTASENVGEENSYVYFVANGVLASNENANKETAQRGNCKQGEEELTGERTCNLYVAHYDGGSWKTKFIATLTGGSGENSGSELLGDERDWVGYEGGTLGYDTGPESHTARVTPNGAMLAFESERSLTGYDNEPVEPGAGENEYKCTEGGSGITKSNLAVPCREVYLYDAVTGKLVCASCDPSGARPVGAAELGGQERSGLLPASVYYLSRNLSENGGRLFFQSSDALVPHDSNRRLDVYEWEQPASPAEAAKAENSCTFSSPTFSASSGGCVFPISDVAGDFKSKFVDASASGDNVFIATEDQLVPEADADSRANVYDARVGGGFPVTTPRPPCNNGDSCKPPVSSQPGVFGAPASATFFGPGNPTPAGGGASNPQKKTTKKTVRCKKGLVKNGKGKCVKRKKPKKNAKRPGNDRRASR